MAPRGLLSLMPVGYYRRDSRQRGGRHEIPAMRLYFLYPLATTADDALLLPLTGPAGYMLPLAMEKKVGIHFDGLQSSQRRFPARRSRPHAQPPFNARTMPRQISYFDGISTTRLRTAGPGAAPPPARESFRPRIFAKRADIHTYAPVDEICH